MDYAEPPHDPEPVTTIAWRLAHLIGGLASTNGERFGGNAVDIDTFCYAGTSQEALEQLDQEYGTWIAGVRRLGALGLGEAQGAPPAFADAPMARKILYTNVELIHHGAEVCLLRDLFLHSGRQ
jgi:hypothetical protein